jgi:hypothetical protein
MAGDQMTIRSISSLNDRLSLSAFGIEKNEGELSRRVLVDQNQEAEWKNGKIRQLIKRRSFFLYDAASKDSDIPQFCTPLLGGKSTCRTLDLPQMLPWNLLRIETIPTAEPMS